MALGAGLFAGPAGSGTCLRWVERGSRDRLGDVAAGRQTSHTPGKLDGHDDALQARVVQCPDATLAEHCTWARAEPGISLGITARWKRLRKLKLTLKKVPGRHRASARCRCRAPPAVGGAEAHV